MSGEGQAWVRLKYRQIPSTYRVGVADHGGQLRDGSSLAFQARQWKESGNERQVPRERKDLAGFDGVAWQTTLRCVLFLLGLVPLGEGQCGE